MYIHTNLRMCVYTYTIYVRVSVVTASKECVKIMSITHTDKTLPNCREKSENF